jgi:hypothetical protein
VNAAPDPALEMNADPGSWTYVNNKIFVKVNKIMLNFNGNKVTINMVKQNRDDGPVSHESFNENPLAA